MSQWRFVLVVAVVALQAGPFGDASAATSPAVASGNDLRPALSLERSLRNDKFGFTVHYPVAWSATQRDGVVWLVDAPLANARGAILGRLAQIYITVESRSSHSSALERLENFASEYREPVARLTVGGWPALERQVVVEKPQPGDEEGEAVRNEKVLRILTAVAAGNLLIREEATMPPSLAEQTQSEVRAIETSLTFPLSGSSGRTQFDLEHLNLLPTEGGLPSKLAGANYPPVQRILPVAPSAERILESEEPEIAASPDGLSVMVAAQKTYTVSLNGGQSFGPILAVPQSTGGDASVAYGASGNFYESTINKGQSFLALNRATPQSMRTAQPLSFVDRAFTCPASGLGQCGFSTNGVPYPDQEHLAADRWNETSLGDQVYVVWRYGTNVWGIACSTNSGETFPTVAPPAAGDYPRLTVGSDGSVYVVTWKGHTEIGEGQIELTKFDQCANGLTAHEPVAVVEGFTPVQCPVPGLDRCNAGNALESHMVAVDDTNPHNLFVTYAANPDSAQVGENIYVRYSDNGGRNWGPPAVVNSTALPAHRFMPWICTENGVAWISWYDRRATAAAGGTNDLTNYYLRDVRVSAGALVTGTEIDLSVNANPQCGNDWPSGERNPDNASTCTLPQPSAGRCRGPDGNIGSNTKCDFNTPHCPAQETCQSWGGGVPKYGDYNGDACAAAAAGRVYTAWESATAPPGLPPPPRRELYFRYTDAAACGFPGGACCVAPQCQNGTACVNGVCACGGADQPCCSGNQCQGALQCQTGQCTACGQAGEACCGGNVCEAGGTCVQGRCGCGGLGQACCHPNGTCESGLSCIGGGCEHANPRCTSCIQAATQCQADCHGDARCSCACSNSMISCEAANQCPPTGGFQDCNARPPPPHPAADLGGGSGQTDLDTTARFIDAVYTEVSAQDGMTKDQADQILDELRRIRKTLEERHAQADSQSAPHDPVSLDLSARANALGNPKAKVAIVEFTDYQCPYCAAFHAQTFPKLKAAFIDTGKIWFVSRDLPLSMHENALKAAEAARCAGDQGRFWEMRNLLISNNSDLGMTALMRYAGSLSLDEKRFNTCLESDAHASDIRSDAAAASALQIDGTPTFVIGTLSNGRLTGKVVSGAESYAMFENLIEEAAQTKRLH